MDKVTSALSNIYGKYETFVAEIDAIFNKLKEKYKSDVTCSIGCNDCCYALFDLSFIEAAYINTKFNSAYGPGPTRSRILEQAADIDRKLVKIKKDFFIQGKEASQNEDAIRAVMEQAARVKMRCPLLDERGQCAMYEYRPVTCRLYGAPTVIGDETYVCGKTGFNKGASYETVYLRKVQSVLEKFSLEAQLALGSRFAELHKVYTPISMALLTKYDAKYLGASLVKEAL